MNHIDLLQLMRTNTVRNYVIPGLDSSLLENGKVRLFESSREHAEPITPHSHRFDFFCIVIQGQVTNVTWEPCEAHEGDEFQCSQLTYQGEIGQHDVSEVSRGYWRPASVRYKQGEIYSMRHNEVHSIYFKRDTKVVFFEGPQLTDHSLIIEPVVNGELIPTFQTQPWMFQK